MFLLPFVDRHPVVDAVPTWYAHVVDFLPLALKASMEVVVSRAASHTFADVGDGLPLEGLEAVVGEW